MASRDEEEDEREDGMLDMLRVGPKLVKGGPGVLGSDWV
jgi:hypothetical protein